MRPRFPEARVVCMDAASLRHLEWHADQKASAVVSGLPIFSMPAAKWIFLRPQLYDRMSASYLDHPFRITLVGQMVPTVRIFQAIPAGVLRLPLAHFLAATALGAQGWIASLAGAGYVLRHQGWPVSETVAVIFVALLAFEGVAFLSLLAVTRRSLLNRVYPSRCD